MGIIVIGVAIVVLLIVIIAALSKKKKINHYHYFDDDELDRIERELDEDSDSSSPSIPPQHSQTRNQYTWNGEGISQNSGQEVYSSLLYYVYLDGNTYGPFSLNQLKSYPLLEDTLITTNTLNGSWYEAKYFECLDDLFRQNLPFRIDVDGVIIRADVD